MMKAFFLFLTLSLLLFSCSDAKQGDLLEISVDPDQNVSLALSEIAEDITAIELELTDESLINTDFSTHVFVSENNVIIGQMYNIFVFNKEGKFIRSIGSRGQGPGEYQYINSLAFDERNKRLLIFSSRKIICYDLDGKFLNEFERSPNNPYNLVLTDANYINDELFYSIEQMSGSYEEGYVKSSVVYRLNNDFNVIDSFSFRKTYLDEKYGSLMSARDYILNVNSTVYLYFTELTELSNNEEAQKLVLQDTLCRLEKNQLVPELKLIFKNDGIRGGILSIHLFNIYRSTRYVFAIYINRLDKKCYCFCYDTKTGKGYNMQDGYTDDFNQIETRVLIRPSKLDTEMFYYLHTNMKPDDLEEPNPTLYIGRLKK